MAKPELGTKRQCQSCGTKFYDLSRDPYELDNLLADDEASYRAMSPKGREAVDTLRAALDRLVDCSGVSCR